MCIQKFHENTPSVLVQLSQHLFPFSCRRAQPPAFPFRPFIRRFPREGGLDRHLEVLFAIHTHEFERFGEERLRFALFNSLKKLARTMFRRTPCASWR